MSRRLNEVKDQLLTLAAGGATNRDACAAVGISDRILYTWLADPRYTEFAHSYRARQAQARVRSVNIIRTSDDWRAHAWYLERTDPDHWGRTERDWTSVEQRFAAWLADLEDSDDARQVPSPTSRPTGPLPQLPATTGT